VGASRRNPTTEKWFRVVVSLKGLDGAVQLVAGLVLIVVPPREIADIVHVVVTRDLLGNPAGPLAGHLEAAARGVIDGGGRGFAVAFLLVHAVIKLGLVAALLGEVVPAYPVAALALAVFVVFEVLRAVRTRSFVLPILAVFDVVVIALVLREYVLLRRERNTGNTATREPR
jgi:uncharacterized membrane protein